MPAYVKAEFGVRPVKSIRFKKSGEWREVTKGYIKVGNNIKQWWPSMSDLTGATTTAPVTLVQSNPHHPAWNTNGNDFMVITADFTGAPWFQYFDYQTSSELFVESWKDNRLASGVNQGTSWQPAPTGSKLDATASGFWVLDGVGLRYYPVNQFGQFEETWSFVQSTFPTVELGTNTVKRPPLIIGGDPIPTGATYNDAFYEDLGNIAESNIGYINAPEGKEAFFGANQDFDVDPDGQFAYVVDARNQAIRKVSLSAPYAVTTLAGIGPTGTRGTAYTAPAEPASNVDAVGLDARFKFRTTAASRITIHPSGDYALVHQGIDRAIRRVWLRDVGTFVTGQVETWATAGTLVLGGDIRPNKVPSGVRDMAFDPTGRWLYLAQTSRILKVDMDTPNGTTTLVTGSTSTGAIDSDDATAVRFTSIVSFDVNRDNGWLLVADRTSGGHRIRIVQ